MIRKLGLFRSVLPASWSYGEAAYDRSGFDEGSKVGDVPLFRGFVDIPLGG